MKYFITGVNGQLGHDMMNELNSRGHEAVGSDITPEYAGTADDSPVAGMPYRQLDITDEDAVQQLMTELKPDIIVHCAAWTAVDAAEEENNRARVMAVNAEGTRHLAEAAAAAGASMVYISTDYVFDGQGETPWDPDCRDFAPLNVYGQSKLEGERAVEAALGKFFIVRIAWVFGLSGKNFIRTMLQIGRTHPEIRVVSDQVGTPTYTLDLARLLADMTETEKYGYYHVTNEGGYISWYDFACEIMRQAGIPCRVHPVTTAEYGLSKAARPFNSRLDRSKLVREGFTPLPDWRDALRRYLEELGETADAHEGKPD